MTETPIKVGMIGAGYILQSHAMAVAAIRNLRLRAVADSSAQRSKRAASEFGFEQCFTSVEEIAASDCDVVHVLVPPHLHIEIAQALIEAGKSVFLEKPMGISAEACRRLGELADDRGVRLGINHNFLFLPGYERMRAAIAEREFGAIDHITCNWNALLPQLRAGPFDAWLLSSPANLFFELGPHIAAFILDLMSDAQPSAAIAANPIELPTGQPV